jgi:hypothetical protein
MMLKAPTAKSSPLGRHNTAVMIDDDDDDDDDDDVDHMKMTLPGIRPSGLVA